ncbi:MAG: GGDEF domain-containing protein [Elusimicrobiota bacterium]
MKTDRKRKQAYILFLAFVLFSILSFLITSDTDLIFSILGMASVLLILELGRLRDDSRNLFFFTIAIASFFAVFGAGFHKYYSLAIFLALIPSLKISSVKKMNRLKFLTNMDMLELKKKDILKEYRKSKRRVGAHDNDINRFTKLYELSKDIEQITNSEELAEKSLESLNLKIDVNMLAFYTSTGGKYEILKTMNIDEKTAFIWLEEIDNIKNRTGDDLFKFELKTGDRNIGLIICKGKLNAKNIREAEVLISQINLGYEKTILYERVKVLSRIDGLTGLYLRKHFFRRLEGEIKRARREDYKIAFIMADLDNFKNYNDTYGHPMGDKLLKDVSEIIRHNIYSSDFAGRYGGEEFAIYMPMADREGTIKKSQKIWKLVEKDTPTTISMGISYFPDNAKTTETLIRAADTMLYKAKEEGKNRICQP